MTPTPTARTTAPTGPDDMLTLREIALLSSGVTSKTSKTTVRDWIWKGVGVRGRRGTDRVFLAAEPRGGKVFVKRGDFERFNQAVAAMIGIGPSRVSVKPATEQASKPAFLPRKRKGERAAMIDTLRSGERSHQGTTSGRDVGRRAASEQGRRASDQGVQRGPLAAPTPTTGGGAA